MPGARQPLYPPYQINREYRIVSTHFPDVNNLVKYIGTIPNNPTAHKFERVNPPNNIITIDMGSNNNPNDPPAPVGMYIIGVGNAGGRRKSRNHKSKRKIRRTRRNNKN